MRKIKFRAWVQKFDGSGHMLKVTQIAFWENEVIRVFGTAKDGTYKHKDDEEPITLMMFTGLHDKNGVEIYEGDILQIDDTEDRSTRVVTYSRGCFGGEWERADGGKVFAWLDDPERWLVIGNIWENPELLENSDD